MDKIVTGKLPIEIVEWESMAPTGSEAVGEVTHRISDFSHTKQDIKNDNLDFDAQFDNEPDEVDIEFLENFHKIQQDHHFKSNPDFAKGKTLRYNPPKEWRKTSPMWELKRNPQYLGFLTYIHYVDAYFQKLKDESQMGAGLSTDKIPPRRFCEIGSYMGESTQMVASSGLFDEIYSIDPHSGEEEANDMFGYDWDYVKSEYATNMRHHRSQLTYIQKKSTDVGYADAIFSDFYFDVVYIDADHRFEHVAEDLKMFTRKTKHIISGHDFGQRFDGVQRALEDLVGVEYLNKHLTLFEDSSWALTLDHKYLNVLGDKR